MNNLNSKEQAAARKRRSRARQQSQFGQQRIEIVLSHREHAMLLDGCKRRNPGRTPYLPSEYLALLVFCDGERLARQESALGNCQRCHAPLPEGCNALFLGETTCWFTRQSSSLHLTDVTGHAQLDEVQKND
jgi:hypothetical protein